MTTHQTGERGVRGRSRQRRQKLLDATIEIMAEQGLAAVTHRAVAAAAELPPSSTSYFFESIDELMAEAVTAAMNREVARLTELEGAVGDGPASTGRLIRSFADFIRNEHDPHTIAQFEIYLYASRKPELRGRVVAIIEATRELAQAALNASGIENPLAAASMLAMIDGFALHRIANPDGADIESLLLGLRALLVGLSALEVVGDTAPQAIDGDPT